MKKKIKTAILWIVPAILAAAVWLIHFEAAARYKTNFTVSVPEIGVVIQTFVANMPAAPADLVYNGSTQTPPIIVPEGTSVSGATSGKDAGTYEITFRLNDPDTSTWPDGTNGDITVSWKILPLEIEIPSASDLSHIYSGTAQGPTISGLNTTYAETAGTTSASSAGRYSFRFRLKDTANTRWADGTTAEKTVNWMIGVCRIKSTLYPSVTEAFGTDRSSRKYPVEMLCHWSENAVNASGTDWFSLNGFSLSSSGITIENRSTLTLLGGGPVLAEGNSSRSMACLLNSGTLTVEDGSFSARYQGTADGGLEVYGIWNTSGSTVIRGGTVSAGGGTLAADAIFVEGGSLRVEGGTFSAVNDAPHHGAYALWMEDGDVEIADGTFSCQSGQNGTVGFCVVKGNLTFRGGTAAIESTEDREATFLQVLSGGNASIEEGSFTVASARCGAGVRVGDGGTLALSGGTISVDFASTENAPADAVYVAGALEMSGGSISVTSQSANGSFGIGVEGGSAVITGGSVSVRTTAPGDAYGIMARNGDCSVNGLTMEVIAQQGSGNGVVLSESGSFLLETGQFTVKGYLASPGESTVSPIQTPVANVDCAFYLFYKNSWNAGLNFSNPPYIASATRVAEVRGLPGNTPAEEGLQGSFRTHENVLALHQIIGGADVPPEDFRSELLGAIGADGGAYDVFEESGENGERMLRIVLKDAGKDGEPEENPAEPGGDEAEGSVLEPEPEPEEPNDGAAETEPVSEPDSEAEAVGESVSEDEVSSGAESSSEAETAAESDSSAESEGDTEPEPEPPADIAENESGSEAEPAEEPGENAAEERFRFTAKGGAL
ncbi:MAG: hypothetical protein IKY02_03825, partial [Lachnospiraceae bacterium]|nr:hypothetical protein [Lachnospiraceae bacterium]